MNVTMISLLHIIASVRIEYSVMLWIISDQYIVLEKNCFQCYNLSSLWNRKKGFLVYKPERSHDTHSTYVRT